MSRSNYCDKSSPHALSTGHHEHFNMAEEDAEISLLHQMQAGQEDVAWGEDNEEVADGDLLEDTDSSDEKVKTEETIADDQALRAISPSITGVHVDGGASATLSPLHPAVMAVAASQQHSRSSSRASTKKTKTIAGFVDDDSDSESTSNKDSFSQAPESSIDPLAPFNLQNGNAAQTPVPNDFSGDSFEAKVQVPVSAVFPNAGPVAALLPKIRLPQDTVGILEDRIKEDSRGDIDAWLSLISEHRKRNKLDDARALYDRFLKLFPSAAEIWVEYAEMELANDNFFAAEQIFGRSLMTVPSVALWSVYLNYIRRRNDLTNDASGTARVTIAQCYDFVLANIGIDRESGLLWQEYLQFVKSAPGNQGGTTWQDQQKMDQLRKAYQRAICVPMSSVNNLWKEYDQFEMSLNKMTGRKFLQEKSPVYMTARSANTALDNMTRGLIRTTLPRLPPALGFDGDQEYSQQVELWRRWIIWEKDDPLVLKDEDAATYKQRILYVFRQALMALRFWAEIWIEAAEWCFENNLEKEGSEFLTQGITANPESCLLAFKQADRLELVLPLEEGEEGLANRGAVVRQPYNHLLDALYDLIPKLKARESAELSKIEDDAALDTKIGIVSDTIAEENDEDTQRDGEDAKNVTKARKIDAVKQGYVMQTNLIKRTISFVWIALTRAMRRVQGKGKVGAMVGGSRQILTDARQRGQLTSDVYVASALIEHHVYKDIAGTKIFERGAKLFPEDGAFILEYLKHLMSTGDTTNGRAVFETAVSRLAQKPELVHKTKPLYVFFHKYESEYGELSQISKLERRMADLFPEDPKLQRFSSRFSANGFDPTAVRPIISPTTQMRPRVIMQSIEQPSSVQNSPRPQFRQELSPRPHYRPEVSPRPTYLQTNSPKRPYGEDSDTEAARPRKLARGESPLKGAAGRRLDQQKRLQQNQGTPAWQSNVAPFVIPRDITFLLSIIPRAETYTATRFSPEAMVRLLGQTQVPEYGAWKANRDQQGPPQGRHNEGVCLDRCYEDRRETVRSQSNSSRLPLT